MSTREQIAAALDTWDGDHLVTKVDAASLTDHLTAALAPDPLRDGLVALLEKWTNEDGDIEFESGFDGMRMAREIRALLGVEEPS